MPKKRKLDPFLLWLYLLFGTSVQSIEISLEQPTDGFFLRDVYNKNAVQDPNIVSKTFIVNQRSDLYKIKAQYGPFESHHTLSRGLLDAAYSRNRKNNSQMHRSIVYNMDVSVHIVSKDISPKIPKLQVLVHTSPLLQGTKGSENHWCAQIFAEANGKELSSVCIINDKDKICVASLDLPKEWWTDNSTSVKVSYSFSGIDQNDQCASASNSIIPERSFSKNHSDDGIMKEEITTLQLIKNEESFDEWKDQDILIDVPREMFHQADTFEIPIRLEKNSDLQIFVMRARVRQGLRITGARMMDPSSQWSIHVDIKEHQKTGTVTAYVRDSKIYKKSLFVQDLFRWQMEVAEDTYDTRDLGRVVWSIEYQQNGLKQDRYLSEDSKIISQINIRSKDQQRLVPVLKVREIINMAILTGWEQVYSLRIYAVDDTDRLTDVTKETKCHSVEVDVLKVSGDCMSVYVDGAENRGSYNVTIIAKNGQTTAFLDVAVWIPVKQLDIQLSDTKLSRVKNWKTPGENNRIKRASDPYNAFYYDKLDSVKGRSCELMRQQSLVEVFAQFYIQTPKQTDYFMGPGTYLKVTDLVKGRLRMSDTRIATLTDDNVILGHEEGRTEIQLLSPQNGHVLATREIHVSHDKVMLKRLDLSLITGMTMYVEPSSTIDGALVATADINSQFVGKHHVGIIDVEAVYSDGTTLPMKYISSEDYFLEVLAEDHNIVAVALTDGPAYQPKVVAKGEGNGDLLKVFLKVGEKCSRKKAKPLIAQSMYIDIDFSQDSRMYKRPQQDAHFDTNRPSDRWDVNDNDMTYSIKTQSKSDDDDDYVDNKFIKMKSKQDSNDLDRDQIEDALVDLVDREEEAKREPLRTGQEGLTNLEIGMYVLLSVLCVGMTVFMVNCIIFYVRYKRKQKPRKAGSKEAIKNANDWVWIGRATLERNSVYTRSSRTLMPDEDFNGNVNTQNQRPLSVGSTSSSGSSSQASTSSACTNPNTNNSNRNSVVSTYKGSECSIRITANPLTEEGAMGGLPEETQSEAGAPQWDYEAMGMNYEQLLKYFDNLKESNA